MSKEKIVLCEVRLVQDRATHVPFGVCFGRMVVSRHATEAEAERIRDKLNRKIERRSALGLVYNIANEVRKV